MLLRKCWHIARPPAPRPRPTSIKRHLARERHTWHSRHTTHNTQATTSAIYPPNDSKAHTLFNAIVHHCDRCVISHTPDLHAPFAAPPRTQISEWTLQPPPPLHHLVVYTMDSICSSRRTSRCTRYESESSAIDRGSCPQTWPQTEKSGRVVVGASPAAWPFPPRCVTFPPTKALSPGGIASTTGE
jgi:hypothetical protein